MTLIPHCAVVTWEDVNYAQSVSVNDVPSVGHFSICEGSAIDGSVVVEFVEVVTPSTLQFHLSS